LPAPAEIEALLRSGDTSAVAATITDGLLSGVYRWSHRVVLLNAVARLDPAALPELIAVLRRRRDDLHDVADDTSPLALWEALIEVADTRRQMLAELRPPEATP
jgi:hypothetical protein